MNIQEIKEKSKSLLKSRDFLTVSVVMLVGFASFGLGRLSKIEDGRIPIKIEYEQTVAVPQGGTAENSSDSTTLSALPGAVVASKSGTKYHFPWCSGANTISEANKIWFATTDLARSAGYTPAANCKGLK